MSSGPFDARITVAEGVSLSDLILAPPPARPGDALEPFIDRISASRVMAYLEMHASDRERLPDAVRIVITRADGDDALVTAAAEVTAPANQGWAVARALVPTDSLQPGRYVARAEIMTSGRTIARVLRPFTIRR